jgi:hypothetical protein
VSDNCTPAGGLVISQDPPAGVLIAEPTTILLTVTDTHGNASQCTTTLTVVNSAPVIASITGPSAPVALGNSANVTVNFTDSDLDQEHTCTFLWDDGSSETVPLAAGLNTASRTHTYAAPGVYTVTVTVTDPCTSVSQPFEFVVIYDSEGGFVTGGGWIDSPAGAYIADPSLTGKANFGFVSKYQQGADVPTGETQFQFKTGNLNFHSSVYEWLVVAGNKAQFKGSGTINNSGDYRFILTASDGQQPGGDGQDKFRIRIWNNNGGGLVYDNQWNAPNSAEPTTVLSGGSIVIHK